MSPQRMSFTPFHEAPWLHSSFNAQIEFSKGNKHERGDDLLKLEASVIKKLKHFKK